MKTASSATSSSSCASGAKRRFRHPCSTSQRATSRSRCPWEKSDRRSEMKYADYYAALGVERGASPDAIKKAYRRLAQKYHPDVSKEPGAEARFKEIAEAYQTLKDPEKRAAYDALGSRPQGEEFRPPPDWARQHAGGGEQFSFDDVDFSDLFSRFGSRAGAGAGPFAGADGALPGQDFEVPVEISIEDAFHGTTLSLSLSLPEYDSSGRLRRVPHTVKARVAP